MDEEIEGRGGKRIRRIGREETRVREEFYKVGDPLLAAQLIAHMDQDAQVKRMHSGL